jgi:hypothetical protein
MTPQIEIGPRFHTGSVGHAARFPAISGNSTIYTGRSPSTAGVRCAAAILIGTAEASDRP